MSSIETILISVVAGICTTAVLFSLNQIIKYIMIPWYQDLTYKGVDISGAWKYQLEPNENGDFYMLKFNINQKAHNMSGSAEVFKKINNKEENISLKLSGYLWEGYLTLNLLPRNRKITTYATCLFKVTNGGKILDGKFMFRNNIEDKVSILNTPMLRQ